MTPIPIIVIEGPTAAGKSKLALELAVAMNTEIISADSRQIYRFLDIGTAKPSKAELSSIPHHLVDIINPDESYNAGLFCQAATRLIQDLQTKGKVPIICGGTGMYIKSLLEGLFNMPARDLETETGLDAQAVRQQLRSVCEANGLASLYAELLRIDPDAAAKISSSDSHRILRALEIYNLTGKPISKHWREQQSNAAFQPFRILVDAPRDVLYSRINQRVEDMVQNGLPDEIQIILNKGYSWDAAGFNSVGYKEFRPYFEARLPLRQCVEQTQQHTRNYAKRQCTWYRKCTFHLTIPCSEISISTIGNKIKDFMGA